MLNLEANFFHISLSNAMKIYTDKNDFPHRISSWHASGEGIIDRLTINTEKGPIELEFRDAVQQTAEDSTRTFLGWTGTVIAAVAFWPISLTVIVATSIVGAAYAAYLATLPRFTAGYYIHNANHDKPIIPVDAPIRIEDLSDPELGDDGALGVVPT